VSSAASACPEPAVDIYRSLPWAVWTPSLRGGQGDPVYPGLSRRRGPASGKASVVGERCCLPNNYLEKPKANHESHNNFVHTIALGKTNILLIFMSTRWGKVHRKRG
jgi:hypothetical protein